MPSQKNISSLEEVQGKVDKSTAMFFVDYAGLTHKQLEEARMLLGEANSEMAVIKNTLMNIALQTKKVDAKEKLTGQKATLFSYEDPIKTTKVLTAFIKKYGLPKISFGVFDGDIIDEGMITKLATLPSKEILIGKLLGLLNSPLSGLVYVLNGNITKLAQVLKEIEKKKATNSQPAPTPAAVTPEEPVTVVPETPAAETPVVEASEATDNAEKPVAAEAAESTEETPVEVAAETTEAPVVEDAEKVTE